MRVLNYLLIGAGLCFSAFVTNAFEPVATQMVWQSDLEVGAAADFLVKAEPTRVAEGPLGVSVDLRIYGQKNGKQYLAFEDKNIGTQIYGMFHTGQVELNEASQNFKKLAGRVWKKVTTVQLFYVISVMHGHFYLNNWL